MQNIQHIALLMAMREEAAPIIDALQLKLTEAAIDSVLPMQVFTGSRGGVRLSLLVSGVDQRYGVDYIGTQAATLSAYAAIRDLQPDVLISAGTAGGFADLPQGRGAEIGRVYLSDDQFVYHDRRVPLLGLDESAVGHYPCLNVRGMARDLGLACGVVSSGSSLQKSDQDIAVIEQYAAVAKEMEAAAIAWVAWLHNKPCFAIKAITNLLDRPGASEDLFVENLACASAQLKAQVLLVLDYMQGKSLQELAA